MIKFFRKIRQQLLSRNKFSKYLLYALGEIILVVVGILIALQLNNLNENRKNRITEIQILQSIQKNLQEDQKNLDRSIDRYLLTQKYILRFFNPLPIPDDSLAFVATRMSGHAPFVRNETAFTLAVNSGKLDLVKDKDLVQQIQRLYAFEYPSVDNIHDNIDVQMKKLRALTEQYEAFDIKQVVRSDEFYDQSYVLPWNLNNLKLRNEDPKLRAALKHSYPNIDILLTFYYSLKKKNQHIQDDIKRYMEAFL